MEDSAFDGITFDILTHIIGFLTNDPISMMRLMMTCRELFIPYCIPHVLEDPDLRHTVDNLWKTAANNFCRLSLLNGPFGPPLGSGHLYDTWFSYLVCLGGRNKGAMQRSLPDIQQELERLGPIKQALAGRHRHRARILLRELGERRAPVPKQLRSFHVPLKVGMVINCISDDHPVWYVKAIDRQTGLIELVNTIVDGQKPIYRSRGQLCVADVATCLEKGTTRDHLLTGYESFVKHHCVNHAQLISKQVSKHYHRHVRIARMANKARK